MTSKSSILETSNIRIKKPTLAKVWYGIYAGFLTTFGGVCFKIGVKKVQPFLDNLLNIPKSKPQGFEITLLHWSAMLLFFFIGICCNLGGLKYMVISLKHIGASYTSGIYFITNYTLALLANWLIFGGIPSGGQWIGSSLFILGLYFVIFQNVFSRNSIVHNSDVVVDDDFSAENNNNSNNRSNHEALHNNNSNNFDMELSSLSKKDNKANENLPLLGKNNGYASDKNTSDATNFIDLDNGIKIHHQSHGVGQIDFISNNISKGKSIDNLPMSSERHFRPK